MSNVAEQEVADISKETTKDQSAIRVKKKKRVWITKTIAEDGPRDVFLHVTLTETLEFVCILIIITLIVLGGVSSSMFYLTEAIRREFVDAEFETADGRTIAFADIKSAADFWGYLEHAFTDSFYWDYWYDRVDPVAENADGDSVIYENKLLGVPRLRQVKVRNDSCEIHDTFKRHVKECYGDYDSANEDTEPYGLMSGTAWTYTKFDGNSLPYIFRNSDYFVGGYYQDMSKTREESLESIAELKRNLWITRGTRAVFLDFAVYNANMNFFCVVHITFEFPSTGGVVTSAEILTHKFLRYMNNWDHFIFGLEIIYVAYIVYVIVEETREMIYFRGAYFKRFWNYIDLTIILLTIACVVIVVYTKFSILAATEAYESNENGYVDYYRVAVVQTFFNNLAAIVLFFNYIKIFKYITFNKMMAQMNNTIKNCATDVAGFLIMFFIVFIAFAELGYLIFGKQVSNFATFGVSMFTLLRTILGDFDYEEIAAVDEILAPMFFLSFIVLVFFVLLNMFLAIINDTYGDVKTELTVAPDEMQMQQYLKRGYYNLLRSCKCRTARAIPKKIVKNEFDVTIEEIRGALKKCGFNDLEMEMFFAKYNIDPNATMGDYNVADLLAELERPEEVARSPDWTMHGKPVVALNDFQMQQEKLDVIETKIGLLVDQVKSLLGKLDELDGVQKKPRD